MNSTIAKTYRMPAGIHVAIVEEAERLKTSEADVVRMALRSYFESHQQNEVIEATEARIVARIDAQGERLGHLIGEILAMAQPQ